MVGGMASAAVLTLVVIPAYRSGNGTGSRAGSGVTWWLARVSNIDPHESAGPLGLADRMAEPDD